jgi:hypothetical protein
MLVDMDSVHIRISDTLAREHAWAHPKVRLRHRSSGTGLIVRWDFPFHPLFLIAFLIVIAPPLEIYS